jgi:hypothetical protein
MQPLVQAARANATAAAAYHTWTSAATTVAIRGQYAAAAARIQRVVATAASQREDAATFHIWTPASTCAQELTARCAPGAAVVCNPEPAAVFAQDASTLRTEEVVVVSAWVTDCAREDATPMREDAPSVCTRSANATGVRAQ